MNTRTLATGPLDQGTGTILSRSLRLLPLLLLAPMLGLLGCRDDDYGDDPDRAEPPPAEVSVVFDSGFYWYWDGYHYCYWDGYGYHPWIRGRSNYYYGGRGRVEVDGPPRGHVPFIRGPAPRRPIMRGGEGYGGGGEGGRGGGGGPGPERRER